MADDQSFSTGTPAGWVLHKVVIKKNRPIPVYWNLETGQMFWGKEELMRYVRYWNNRHRPQESQQLIGSSLTLDASSAAQSSMTNQ